MDKVPERGITIKSSNFQKLQGQMDKIPKWGITIKSSNFFATDRFIWILTRP